MGFFVEILILICALIILFLTFKNPDTIVNLANKLIYGARVTTQDDKKKCIIGFRVGSIFMIVFEIFLLITGRY